MAEFESVNDALIGAVKALGGSKQVGPLLWPEKAPDAAQRVLLDCLNADRPAHLTPDQVLFVLRQARKAGYHDAVNWLLNDAGYAATAPLAPRDEAAELQRQFIAATEHLASIMRAADRLALLDAAPVLGGAQLRRAV